MSTKKEARKLWRHSSNVNLTSTGLLSWILANSGSKWSVMVSNTYLAVWFAIVCQACINLILVCFILTMFKTWRWLVMVGWTTIEFSLCVVNFLFAFSFAKNKIVFLGQFSFLAFFCKEQKCVIAAGQDEGPGVDHILKCTFASFALLNNHQNQHNHHHPIQH